MAPPSACGARKAVPHPHYFDFGQGTGFGAGAGAGLLPGAGLSPTPLPIGSHLAFDFTTYASSALRSIVACSFSVELDAQAVSLFRIRVP